MWRSIMAGVQRVDTSLAYSLLVRLEPEVKASRTFFMHFIVGTGLQWCHRELDSRDGEGAHKGADCWPVFLMPPSGILRLPTPGLDSFIALLSAATSLSLRSSCSRSSLALRSLYLSRLLLLATWRCSRTVRLPGSCTSDAITLRSQKVQGFSRARLWLPAR